LIKPQRQASIREVLARLVERMTYHNTQNGFCVLGAKARGIAIR
jgi:exodeoxyribonuclease V alpha subunit